MIYITSSEIPSLTLDSKNKLFSQYLRSISIATIKEIIKDHNSMCKKACMEDELIKGISKFKKMELIEKCASDLPLDTKTQVLSQDLDSFTKKLFSDAVDLIDGIHKTDQIVENKRIPGKNGFQITYIGYGSKHTATAIVEKKEISLNCDCRIGIINGMCIHQTAAYLGLYRRKKVSLDQFPFPIQKNWFDPLLKKLHHIEAQTLYAGEPDVLLSIDYKIFVHEDQVLLDWAGDFANKKTINMNEQKASVEDWVAEKVIKIMLKPLHIKERTGTPVKILADNIGIIDYILAHPPYVEKILKKFSHFPGLPQDIQTLETFLKVDLGNMSLLKTHSSDIPPPFEAYNGDEPYIFVSYAHLDKNEVFPIIHQLHLEGMRIWYDQGIPMTTDWANTIATRLMNCTVFLSFISPNILPSKATQDEIQFALNENRQFFAIYMKETELTPGLKMRIRSIQGLEKFKMAEHQFYHELKSNLKNYLPN